MMVKKIINLSVCMFLVAVLFIILDPSLIDAENSRAGYKEFKLGQAKKNVQDIINTRYKDRSAGYLKNGNIIFKTNDNTEAHLVFDHNNFLYKIEVEIKFGKASNLESILVQRYGKPNDFTKEQYYPGDKRYLVAQWLINKKDRISLFESEYCRNSKLIPCRLKVIYLGIDLLQKKLDYEKDYKKKMREKELQKKYEGF